MRKQLILSMLGITMLFVFCFTTSAMASYFPFVSPIHAHQARQSTLSPKVLSEAQSRFVQDCLEEEQNYPKKAAYLTFDDGPNQYTSHILDILEREKVQATFFVIGSQVSRYPELLQAMQAKGHYLGLHSMSHETGKLYNSDPAILVDEMQQTKQLLATITGVDSNLVRVPYGSRPYLKQPHRDALVEAHFKLWDWTIDTDDWKRKQTADSLLQDIQKQIHQDVEVILMHDSAITVQALPRIITLLRKNGYELLPYSPNYHVEVNFWNDMRL